MDKSQLDEPERETEPRGSHIRVDVAQSRAANPQLALHERLLFAAVIAGVSLLIRIVEVIPERRRR